MHTPSLCCASPDRDDVGDDDDDDDGGDFYPAGSLAQSADACMRLLPLLLLPLLPSL